MRRVSNTFKRAISYVIVFVLIITCIPSTSLASEEGNEPQVVADTLMNQPGAKNQWRVTGNEVLGDSWNEVSSTTLMKHLGNNFFEYSIVSRIGTMQFKFTKNGSWDNSIGSKTGGNFEVAFSEPTKVNFYLKEKEDGSIDYRIYIPGLSTEKIKTLEETHGIKYYNPTQACSLETWPRLVGNIQEVFGEGSWSPGSAQQYFVDYNFDGTVYKLQRTIPVGAYEAKVIFGNSWDGYTDYGVKGIGGSNLSLNVLDESLVTFTLDLSDTSNPTLGHNYRPADSQFDGAINSSKLYFDSRSITYKKPFGAIKEGTEDVTFRIAAEQGDVEVARLEVTNGSGIAKTYDMQIATIYNGKDYFEYTVPASEFNGIGIWSYKFILIDGAAKVEYGDDSLSGGAGMVSDSGQVGYNLTVYDKDYKTPDWMKNAVVYQIFPDRFYDGDAGNNRAKTVDGYRGTVDASGAISSYPYQYFDGGVTNEPTTSQVWGDWNSIPENPRQSEPEQKYNYPNAKTDGQWSNEFYGGDIKGIQEKLTYLKSLGVTAIYLNPVSWAASNHKYDATDYAHLDPMFGEPVYNMPGDPKSGLNYEATRIASDKVYIAFANAASEAGIQLICDGVFNHVGDDSIYFDRYEKYPEIGAYEFWKQVWDTAEKDKISKNAAVDKVVKAYEATINTATGKNYSYPEDFEFVDWFVVGPEKTADGIYKYDAWWGYDSLPAMEAKGPQSGDNLALNGEHEYNNVSYREKVIGYDLSALDAGKAEEMLQVSNSQRWLWMGASGWRLDVAPDVSVGTWQQFRKAVKSATGKADANGKEIADPVIIGEEWGVATNYLLGDQFDSVMNYQFRAAIQSFLINGNAAEFNRALETIRENYPEEAFQAMLNLVDSHDTVRNLTKIDNPTWEEENTKIAPEASDRALDLQELTAIFQMGYPGAPTIYYGDEVGVTGTKDPDSRRTFPWERITQNGDNFQAAGRYKNLFATYQQAGKIRNDYLELFATGDMKIAYAEGDVIAYARKSQTKGGMIAINRSETAKEIQMDVLGFLPNDLSLTDQLNGVITATVTDGKITITIPAYSGVMMVSDGDLESLPAVTKVNTVDGNGSVAINFDSVTGADSYNIYRTALEGTQLSLVGEAMTNSYIDNTVTNGVRYYYYVTAVKGSSESLYSKAASALPAFTIESISIPTTDLNGVILGVGNKTGNIAIDVKIPGLTDNEAYQGKDVPNVVAKLVYYPQGDTSYSQETKFRFNGDGKADDKTYYASFEPTEAGTYEYYAKVSTNNGFTFMNSQIQTIIVNENPEGAGITPENPSLAAIQEESNRATLTWDVGGNDIRGFEIYRTTENITKKVAVLEADKAKVKTGTGYTFTDFTVSNDIQYTYKVAVYDSYYNRAYSEVQNVTPKLVMVDVTLRLHIPNYTPVTDDIYIAGDFNGWNASGGKLTVPSGATSRDVVEYTFKMMAGKSIQYKYTRGKWETEAFASHTRQENDQIDEGNWAYSSTDTNMKLTVANQGSNKMVINDYVLRWVDMPMIITLPRSSFGEDISYTTTDKTYTLKGYVPFGVKFTINGTDINSIKNGAMDRFGNVYAEGLPLASGENEITLHIEPTAETLALPFYKDQGRASQATKTITMTITRTGDDENDDGNNSGNNGNNNGDDGNNNGNNGNNNGNNGNNNGNNGNDNGNNGNNSNNNSDKNKKTDLKKEEKQTKQVEVSELLVQKQKDGTLVTKIEEKGEYDFKNAKVEGRLEISTNHVTIKNLNLDTDVTIKGKDIVLENATIKGAVNIPGGSSNTITLKGTTAEEIIIKKSEKGSTKAVTLCLSKNSKIKKFYIKAAANIEIDSKAITQATNNTSNNVIDNLYISTPKKSAVSLKGVYNKVTISSSETTIKLKTGSIKELIIKKTAGKAKIALSKNTTIKKYTLDKGVTLTGKTTKTVKVTTAKATKKSSKK